ncbi:MAG: hypothetical protein JWO37_348 [Acidimicrobiales bacterium]|nr:hypothetical protein [Acidimicrobiales bacterium]
MTAPRHPDIGLRSRGVTYLIILGVVMSMLVAGLAVPFLFGSVPGAAPSALHALAPGSSSRGGSTSSATDGNGQPTGGSPLGPSGTATPTGAGNPAFGGPGNPAGTLPADRLSATDRGVTATTIKVGIGIADLGSLSKLGVAVPSASPQDQEAPYTNFINYLNGRGGVLGRKIVPDFITYDPLSATSMQAACLKATQDDKVFAMLDTGLESAAQICVARAGTPLIDNDTRGVPVGMFEQANGLLFSEFESGVRSLANMVSVLASRGALKGKTIGIIDDVQPGDAETVTAGAVNVLKQLGYNVAYRQDFEANGNTAPSQAPVAVAQMRAHGVDTIFFLIEFVVGTSFVQQADSEGYRPQYYAADWQAVTNDITLTAMPSTFQATAITTSRVGEWRVGQPEPAPDASCRETYKKITGQDVQRSSGNSYVAMTTACGLLNLFSQAATAAGANLTRPRLSAALQRLGAVALPGFGGASFAPGKFDGADPIRTLVNQSACKCWMPTDSFVKPNY